MKGEKGVGKWEGLRLRERWFVTYVVIFFLYLYTFDCNESINSNDPQFDQFLRSKHGSPFGILQCITCCSITELTVSAQLMFDPM